MTEVEKACAYFDGCHRNGSVQQDQGYYIGVLLCSQLAALNSLLEASGGAPADVVRTPVSVLAASGGTVPANAKYILFIFSSTFTGTVNGVAYTGGAGLDSAVDFPILPRGEVYAAVPYTVTAGNIRITYVQ